MNKREIEQLVARQAAAWQAADLEAITADFAADATFASPGGTWHGPAEIAEAARDFFAACSGVDVEIKRVLVDGDWGAIEWVWHETRRATDQVAEQVVTMEDAIIFELRDGQIVYWREYFLPI